MSAVSRVFMNGNSQAVRIPQEFRLDTNTVEISRNEQGDLVEMTGFVMGPCDKVLRSYFQTLFPIQVAERGKMLPARVPYSF